MNESAEFQRLHWFSPAFPVGGYAYSHGIEMAVETGDVRDAPSLERWIGDILRLGAGRNDAILLAETWRRVQAGAGWVDGLCALNDLALALGLSSERRLETVQQGTAFYALIVKAWPHEKLPELPEDERAALAFPVAVGMAGAAHNHVLFPLTRAYLQGFAGNLIAAGIRLAIIGQSEAQARLAALMPLIAAVARKAETQTLDDLGGSAFRADLMSLRHETQTTRLFRS